MTSSRSKRYMELGFKGNELMQPHGRSYREAADNLMSAVQEAPQPLSPYRYSFFHSYCMILREMHFIPSPKEIKTLKRKFLYNEEEPSCFRVSASYCLGVILSNDGEREDAADCYRQGLSVRDAATQQERRKKVESSGEPVSIGYIVDSVGRTIENNLSCLHGTGRTLPPDMPFLNRDDGTPMPRIGKRRIEVPPEVLLEQPGLYERLVSVGGKECDQCHKTCEQLNVATLDFCVRCKMVYYCSRECQRAAWKAGHKQACREPGEFHNGDYCVIRGIQAKPELNGQVVELKHPDPRTEGRWAVELLFRRSSSPFSVSIDKLKHIRPAA